MAVIIEFQRTLQRNKKMRRKISTNFAVVLVALAICLGLNLAVFSQEETSATITGQVTDSTGAIVAGATVIITNTATNSVRRVQTNDDGTYSAFPLEPGTYTVMVEKSGFKKVIVTTTLNAKDRRPIEVILEVGSVSETVTITDDPPLLQDSPTGQSLVSGNQVTELPLNNRNFIRLLETLPGVSSDLDDESNFGLTSRASVSINGLRRNAVNYLVDGVANVDVGSNITLLSTPTVDSIKEFKVLSSNYTAEIGRSGGGAVILVTKGGGNKYRGSIYEFVRNDYFNANSFFNNRLGNNADGTPRAKTPKLRYNNFGGTFSGPLPFLNFGEGVPVLHSGKDRTFFFFSSEVRRIKRAVTDASITVPTVLERQGNFSATLGLPICRNAAGTSFGTACTGTVNIPVTAIDTAGNTIAIRQNQVFRPSDNRPYAGNIIPTSDIDIRSLGLLSAYPLPNIGTNGFTYSPVNINNTRQEVIRIDHNINSNHKIFGRYTQDTSETQESSGLFNNILLPNVSTTDTSVPGKVFALSWTGIFSNSIVNELTYNYSSNVINSVLVGRGLKSDYANAGSIREFFPENPAGAIPQITSRLSSIGSTQGYNIEYGNHTFRDILTWTTGNHTLKFGAEIASEVKNENLGGNSAAGTFGFSALQTQGLVGTTNITGTGDSFGSFLLGRANTYSESQFDPRVHLSFGRREFFVQDTWKVRPNLTLDLGVRYQFYVPPTERDNFFVSFNPQLYRLPNVAIAPASGTSTTTICTSATCAALNTAVLDPLNGISRAGINSPFGRSLIPSDKNNFSPRVGLAYQPNFENGFGSWLFGKPGQSVIRLGYGLYYDQALVGIFENATFFTPPVNTSVSFTSTSTAVITYDNPGAPFGGSIIGATYPARSLAVGSIAPDFENPESQVWSVGIQREIFKNAVYDVSYVGTKGDKLIRRRNINFVTPQTLTAPGNSTANVNQYRPYLGWTVITQLETSAISRYHGLLSSFNYRLSKGFTITLAYTFSKNLTDSTNDRDAIDDPQNPFNTRAEYAEARTSRPHIFSASYVYEIPFFRKSDNAAIRFLLGGWQVSGITNIESGAPVPRIVISATDQANGARGIYPNLVSDPNGGLAGTIDSVTGLPFIFDPNAFEIAQLGQFGNLGRSFARLPGRNQTNLILSKNFYFGKDTDRYLQIRAGGYNLFNHTQFIGVTAARPTTGTNFITGSTFARPTATRLPREFQFGIKLYF